MKNRLLQIIIPHIKSLVDIYIQKCFLGDMHYACILNENGIWLSEESFFLGHGQLKDGGKHTDWSKDILQTMRWEGNWSILSFDDEYEIEVYKNISPDVLQFIEQITPLIKEHKNTSPKNKKETTFAQILYGLAQYINQNSTDLFSGLFLTEDFQIIVHINKEDIQELSFDLPVVKGNLYSLEKYIERKKIAASLYKRISDEIGDLSKIKSQEEFEKLYFDKKKQLGI